MLAMLQRSRLQTADFCCQCSSTTQLLSWFRTTANSLVKSTVCYWTWPHGHVYLVFTLKMMMFHTYVGVLDGKTTWSPTSLHDLAVVAQPTASSIAPCAERRSSKSSALGDVSIAMVKSFWNHCRLYLGHCQRSMAKEGGGWSWNTDDRKLL